MLAKGFWQYAQDLPLYHWSTMFQTRHAAGSAFTWERHSCPQFWRSGQREHWSSRTYDLPNTAWRAALFAFTCTAAALCVSGQVITRSPRYFAYVRSVTINPKTTAPTTSTIIAARIRLEKPMPASLSRPFNRE